MKTIWARVGQPAVLSCELQIDTSSLADEKNAEDSTKLSVAQLEWRKNGTLIFSAFGRLGRAGALDLTIHAVGPFDQSLFACSITRFAGKGTLVRGREHGKLIRLIVHSTPRILQPMDGSKIFAKRNATIRLNCVADGIPTPNIKWKRKMPSGDWTIIGDNSSQFCIENLSPETECEYICEAENFEGISRSVVSIKIRNSLRIDRENPSMVNKTAIEGSSVFWHCAIEEPKLIDKNNVQIRWAKGGKPISSMEIGLRTHIDGGDFGILHVRRSDSGVYECIAIYSDAREGIVETDRVEVRLNVQYKPEIAPKTRRFHTIATGASADLDCHIDANPFPTIVKWTRNGRELNAHTERPVEEDEEGNMIKSTVHIPSANLLMDAGIYTCEAENAVGATDPAAEIHVVVAEAPKFTVVPAPKYHVKAGGRVEIGCEGFAEVPVKRVWTGQTDGRKIIHFADNKFLIPNVTRADHGTYRCTLVNSIATVFRDVQLFVDDTVPQCMSKFRAECEMEQRAISLHWTPGYSGGNHTQLFRIFYKKIRDEKDEENGEEEEEQEDGWKVTEISNRARARLEGLDQFGKYELKLEASNRFGEVNCTVPGRHHLCTKLPTPSNLRLGQAIFTGGESVPILEWDEMEEAKAYRIKYRRMCGDQQRDRGEKENGTFQEIAQTSDTKYKLPTERRGPPSSCCLQFVVHSVRVPFTTSDPSQIISYPLDGNCASTSTPSASSLFLFSSCGLFFLLILFLWYLFCYGQNYFGKIRRWNWNNNNFIMRSLKIPKFAEPPQGNGNILQAEREGVPVRNSFQCSSSRCPSSSSLTSIPGGQCAFGHPIAITRKLFPDNYICTNFAQFDEEEGEEREPLSRQYTAEEQFGHFSSFDMAFMDTYNGHSDSTNNNNDINNGNSRWPSISENGSECKSSNYVKMEPHWRGGEENNSVGKMFREKYIFKQTEEMNEMDERRIGQLRMELAQNCGDG